MFRKEVNEHSPLRVLEKSIHGGLGVGKLGLVLARAGVGKTAFLVQVGLDGVLRERRVLHVAIDMDIAEVRTWYDELFADLSRHTHLEDRVAAHVLLERNRMIQAYGKDSFSSDKLGNVLGMLKEHVHFKPDVILIDGFDWESATEGLMESLKALAGSHEAELWMTARTHRHETGDDPKVLPAPAKDLQSSVDVALFLKPSKNHVDLRLLKDHDVLGAQDTPLALHPDTMRLVDHRETGEFIAPTLHRDQYTLYSGAAPGAEATFGEFAEKYGISEVNFSFPGHSPARDRGVTELTERKLRQGDVSLSYVARRMNRTYTTSPTFRKVLQSIWHQINNAQQVIVVGLIKDDGTVKGGTGWGAELARVWNKPLWVFDQEKEQWFRWNSLEEKWVPSRTPRLIAANFAGTGTRFLTDSGREAIEHVFETTFAG